MTFIVLQLASHPIIHKLFFLLVGCAYLGQDLGHRNARVDWLLTIRPTNCHAHLPSVVHGL